MFSINNKSYYLQKKYYLQLLLFKVIIYVSCRIISTKSLCKEIDFSSLGFPSLFSNDKVLMIHQ